MNDSEWPLVSALFITYKRFELLKETVESFRRNTDYPRLELVIADDGSGPEIQEQIRKLPADVFALLPKNRGLGANNNNGIEHCSGSSWDAGCAGARRRNWTSLIFNGATISGPSLT